MEKAVYVFSSFSVLFCTFVLEYSVRIFNVWMVPPSAAPSIHLALVMIVSWIMTLTKRRKITV